MSSYASLIIPILKRLNPRSGPESRLAEDVQIALLQENVSIKIESILTKGRVDLRVGGTAIELKVSGNRDPVLRQLNRYAQDPSIIDVILVTTSAKLRALPSKIEGKSLHVIYLPRL